MKLGHLFPRWQELAPQQRNWEIEIDLAGDRSLMFILNAIHADQAALESTWEEFFSLSEAIVTDIVALQGKHHEDGNSINLHFLQFEVALTPVRVLINAREFHAAHDWILNGFSDEVSSNVERKFYWTRVYAFLDSDRAWIKSTCVNHLLGWFANFYYYTRTRAALFEVAEHLLPAVEFASNQEEASVDATINALLFAFHWAAVYEHDVAYPIAEMLLRLFRIDTLTLQNRSRIALAFALTSRAYSARTPRDWTHWLLQEAEQHLSGLEKAQLLIATTESSEDLHKHKAEVNTAIGLYVEHIELRNRTPTEGILLIDGHSSALDPLIYKMHRFGSSGDLLSLLASWYAVPRAQLRLEQPLFILPSLSEGVGYLGAVGQLLPSADAETWQRVIKLTNSALGTIITFRGQNQTDEVPKRLAQPNYELAIEFCDALLNHYRFPEIDSRNLASSFQVVFPSTPHPIQPLMRSAINKSFPISASLKTPHLPRNIKRAGIWHAGTDYYSTMEAEAVHEVLASGGILADTFAGAAATRQQFEAFYSDTRYDLIWIAGHGLYDHWNPWTAAMLFGEAGAITADEIAGFSPLDTARRLLVLNICDGGYTASLGGIQKLGLAPILAGPSQSTISHIWPVEPRVAASFGVLLARHLARASGQSFFESYQLALDDLRLPWAAIVELVRSVHDGELTTRLQNVEFDMSNMFHWASPCFYE